MVKADPRHLRFRLIKAGLALIERSGAAGLSLRAVARRAGVSHMAPYSHFRNRMDLLSALATAGFADFDARIDQAAAAGAPSPREQMRLTGLAYIRFSMERPRLLALMFGGLIPPKEQSVELRSARGRAFALIVNVVRAGQQQGMFKPADPAVAAVAAWSLVHGYSQLALGKEMLAKLGVREAGLLTTAQDVIRRLLDGL